MHSQPILRSSRSTRHSRNKAWSSAKKIRITSRTFANPVRATAPPSVAPQCRFAPWLSRPRPGPHGHRRREHTSRSSIIHEKTIPSCAYQLSYPAVTTWLSSGRITVQEAGLSIELSTTAGLHRTPRSSYITLEKMLLDGRAKVSSSPSFVFGNKSIFPRALRLWTVKRRGTRGAISSRRRMRPRPRASRSRPRSWYPSPAPPACGPATGRGRSA
jgi:hypothetical protein